MTTSGPELVGRSAELALAEECLGAAAAGEPRVILCEGEPGIGKTRLAIEVVGKAAARGLLAAWGVADASTGAPPYWPWRLILRALSRSVDLAAVAAEQGAAIELGRLVPEVVRASDSLSSPPAGPDDRVRQFDAIAGLLRGASLTTPLAIVLDDAHWADEASLLLLHHLVTGLSDERLLLWVNSRDARQLNQGQLLHGWIRSPQARYLQLGPLAEEASRQQLEALTGGQIGVADLAEARTMADGNPFLLTEVARILVARRHGRGPSVMRSAADSVGERLGRLPSACAAALQAGAVLGREFDATVVAGMLGTPAPDCLAMLEEAQLARLIEPAGAPGRHRFLHALVRDAIEAALGPGERAQLHRQAALVIDAGCGGAPGAAAIFQIAQHWREAAVAGDGATAAGWLERAGDIAMRQLAYEDADHLYGEAIRLGGGDLDDADRCRLLLARGRAAGRHGALGVRFESCLEASDLARRLGRTELLAEAALVMEPMGRAGFDLATRRLCQEVMNALGSEPTPMGARVTARFAETYIYLPEPDAARSASLHALTVAERCNDAQALAAALRARQVVVADPEGLAERGELTGRMIRLGGDRGDAGLELQGHLGRIDIGFETGNLAQVAAELEAAGLCAADVGGPVARFRVTQARAVLAQAQGRFADCRALAEEAFRLRLPADFHDRLLMRGALLGTLGRHTGHDDVTLAATGCRDDPAAADAEVLAAAGLIALLSRADVLVVAGRAAEAGGLYRSLGPPGGWRSPPHVVLLTAALGMEIALALGVDEDVAVHHDRLAAYRGHHVACGLIAASYMGPVELWLGKAARRLGRLDEAGADLEEAERLCGENGAWSFQVEAQYERAAGLAACGGPGDRTVACSLLSSAGTSAARLGMVPFTARIAQLLATLEAKDTSPLTSREREIAELVAAGCTNRQIAERLFISQRTAQNHVQHILHKLTLSRRSQVAVWVERSRTSR